LASSDPDEVHKILLTSGTTIISSGYASQVKELVNLLKPSVAILPRIQLIRAYAEYTLGRYQASLACIAEAVLRLEDLSFDDQQFLTYLRDADDYQTGRISLSEYSERQEALIAQQAGGLVLSYGLTHVRYALIAETDLTRRTSLFEKMRSIVALIQAETGSAESFKLQARITLLEAEGKQSVIASLEEIGQLSLRKALGRTPDIRAVLQSQGERLHRWEDDVNSALKEALAQEHPLLVADAYALRASIKIALFQTLRLSTPMLGVSVEIPEAQFQAVIDDAEQAMKIYMQAGQMEGELRATMHLADIFELAGRETAARDLARDVLPKAQAMDYVSIKVRAQQHISEQTLLNQCAAARAKARSEDRDVGRADNSDEILQKYAADLLAALDLPRDRLPVLERDYFSVRDIARERLSWCRHIELKQDLRHTLHPSTLYREDPNRCCMCEKHGYKSAIVNPDWNTVISAFKQTYCAGCPDREPKQKIDVDQSPARRTS
jgi:hypothetical protein